MAGLEESLAAVRVPVGFVAGERSPLPADQASVATAAIIPGAWVSVVRGAGHMPWYEHPGSVRAALDRLVAESEASGGVGVDR
jgi:pimeloyl-ACP methyl ester carboxylesterase